MGIGINVGSKIGSKFSKDTGVKINSKFGTKSQSWGSGPHSQSSSISLKLKLTNLSKGWDWSSLNWCGEIESWSKSPWHYDSWFLSIWLINSIWLIGVVKLNLRICLFIEFFRLCIRSIFASNYRGDHFGIESWFHTIFQSIGSTCCGGTRHIEYEFWKFKFLWDREFSSFVSHCFKLY